MSLAGREKLWILPLVIAAIGCIGLLIHVRTNSQKPAFQNPASQASLKTFVKKLPPGYSIDKTSIEQLDGATAYIAKGTTGTVLAISEQELPTPKKIDKFISENMRNSEPVPDMPYSTVLGDGPLGGKLLSIAANKTWLMVSAPAGASAEEDLIFIAKNL